MRKTLADVRGAYALGVISSDDPEHLIFARNGASPLVIGIGEGEMFVASDTPAILQYTRHEIILQEGEMAVVDRDGYRLMNYDGTPIVRDVINVTWDAASAEKSGYKHFMLKEIFEQPNVIKETLAGRIDDDAQRRFAAVRSGISRPQRLQRDFQNRDHRLRHGLPCRYGRHVFAALARQIAGRDGACKRVSLRRSRHRSDDARHRHVAVRRDRRYDRSGEASPRAQAARFWASATSLGSHLTRIADGTLFTRGGPEIGVAATKTYVSQVTAMTLFALYLARVRGRRRRRRLREIAENTQLLPASVDVVLNTSDQIREVARKIRKMRRAVLFIGRYINFPTALEGALKLKEICYIHAEGYAAGEMKHGPIALLDSSVR